MLSALNGPLRRLPVWAVWLAGLGPLFWIGWRIATADLGPDPVKEIEHHFGKVALWFLLGGLAVTPALRFLRLNLLRYRRSLGLLAFFYVLLHLAVWLWLDMRLLWAQAASDILKRPYLLLGLLAFLLLLPLAVTSFDRAQRRLGPLWRRLHQIVYPAVLLSGLHYVWQMKVITPEGWLWLAAICGLLALRLPGRNRPPRA